MSNTRNRIVNRKNRREKGMRADFLGSNPHSKGEALSRSWAVRIERAVAVDRIRVAKIRIMVVNVTYKSISIGGKLIICRIRTAHSSGAVLVDS